MTNLFIASQQLSLLTQHTLASFEQLWNYEGEWFEPPNRERGGWSGVNFIGLKSGKNDIQGFYLKRQQSFMRRTLSHPVVGEPTFVREFNVLQHLKSHNVATPAVAFFASQPEQAVLLTEALDGYVSLDQWMAANDNLNNLEKKKNLFCALATVIRNMHQVHVQHRSLYPKHLFIKEHDSKFAVALIDFEKSRITPLIYFLRLSDLITLNYRTHFLSRTDRLYFFKQYFGVERLTPRYKLLCRYLYKKSLKK